MRKTMTMLALLAVVGGCAMGPKYIPMTADQKTIAQRMLTERNSEYWYWQNKVDSISFLVRRANLHLCAPDKRRITAGVRYATYRQYAANGPVLFLPSTEHYATIQSIIPGSPADINGTLKPGDHVSEEQLDRLPGVETCEGWPVLLRPGDVETRGGMEAFTDGENIGLSLSMVEWLETADRLAAVIAHETAHVGRRHIEIKEGNATGGAIAGALVDGLSCALLGGYSCYSNQSSRDMARAAAKAYSVEFEREADYVGMYMALNAGFDTSVWSDLFFDLGVRFGQGYGTTHPTNPQRSVDMALWHEQILEDIERQKELGLEDEPMYPRDHGKER